MKIFFRKKVFLGCMFFLILLLAGFLRLWRLDNQSFIADEYIGVNVGYGYSQTGEWKIWDFNRDELTNEKYERGKIYYWQVAQVFKFLEVNEFNARLVSVFWGLVNVCLIFYVAYKITKNKTIALLSALLASTSISALTFDRKLRMYSMLAPVFLAFFWATFLFLEKNKEIFKITCEEGNKKKKEKMTCAKNYMFSDLNWKWFLLVVILGTLSYFTHLVTVNIVPAVFVYFLIMGVVVYRNYKEEKLFLGNRYFYYLFVFFLLTPILFFTRAYDRATGHFGFWINNWSYLEKLTLDYSHSILASTFFALGAYYLIKRNQENQKAGIWLVSGFLTIFFCAVMFWDRSAGHQYIYFIQPLKFIIVASGIYFLAKSLADNLGKVEQKEGECGLGMGLCPLSRFSKKEKIFGFLVVYFLVLLFNFSFFFSKEESFYADPLKWDKPNYRQVYGYFLKHKEPEDVLIMRELSRYYVRGSESNVFYYGSDENKLTLEDVKILQEKYDRIWFITTDGEFNVKGDAKKYIKESFELIETKFTGDKILVWVWEAGF